MVARTQTFHLLTPSFHLRALTYVTFVKLADSRLWMMPITMMVTRKQRKARRMKSSFTEPFAFYKVVSRSACTSSHSNLRGGVALLTSQLRQHRFRKFVTPFRAQSSRSRIESNKYEFFSSNSMVLVTSELINKWLFHAIQMHLLAALMTLHH